MRSATVRTSPVPHSKAYDTFRASDASAVGTGLGSPFLADDFESNSVPQGFIAELLPEHRPAGVEHGFCHPRLRQSGRVHVADNHTGHARAQAASIPDAENASCNSSSWR